MKLRAGDEVWTSLRAQGARAVLSGFGVFWGMLMLVVLLGVGRGVHDGTLASLARYAKNTMLIWEGATSMPFRGLPAGRPVRLTLRDLTFLQRGFPAITAISPRTRLEGDVVLSSGSTSGRYSVYGVRPDYFSIQYMRITDGRRLNRDDEAEARKAAVIGAQASAALYPNSSPIGAELFLRGVVFRIVGVAAGESLGQGQAEVDQAVFIPHATMLQVFQPHSPVDVTALTAAPEVNMRRFKPALIGFLARLRGFDPQDASALWIYDHEQQYRSLMALFTALWAFVWLVGLGTLTAGVVGVSNIMLVSVRERTREFGIRKALGAAPGRLLRMVIYEALLMSAAAGCLGVLAGIGILQLVQRWGAESPYFSNPSLDPRAAAAALAVLTAGGVIAGIVPGMKAARIRPVEALRSE